MNEYTPYFPVKQCTKCGIEYPATSDFFSRSRGGKFGVHSWCKKCVNQYSRGWYRNNSDKVLEKRRQYVAANHDAVLERNRRWHHANKERSAETHREWYKANKEHSNKRNRAYYRANKERVLERTRRYYTEHPELYREAGRRWRKDNPDLVRAATFRRRARIINAAGHHTGEDIQRQYESQRGKCWWCGKPVGDDYHVDHRVPLFRGGSNAPENLVISCQFCNNSKGARLPHEWNGRLL